MDSWFCTIELGEIFNLKIKTRPLLPNMPFFKCQKRTLQMTKKKKGAHFFKPISSQHDGIEIIKLRDSKCRKSVASKTILNRTGSD